MADAIVEIFGDNDPFKKGKDSAREFLKVIDGLVKKSKLLGTTFRKELNSINFKGLKDVQKFNAQIEGLNKTLKATNSLRESQVNLNKKIRDSQKQSNKVTADGVKLQKQAVDTTKQEIAVEQKKGTVERESIKNARERQKLAADQSRTRQVQLRESQALIREKERLRKAEEKEKRNVLQSTNAYKKLTRVTNAAQFQFKSLAAEFGVNSKQAQNALTRLNKLDKTLRQINNTAKDGRRDVGRYGLATKKLGANFKSIATGLVGGLGIVEGLRLLSDAFREGFKVSRDFGLAIAKVGALSGANSTQLAVLQKSALELGATTQFTAAQVAKLQVNLSKLGFDPSQIEASTKAILDFAIASDSDLARSGEVIASALNAFNLEASEAARIADVASVAFKSVPLDLEKFATGLSTVGATAKAAGLSLEETTSLLGILAKNGIEASQAATGLRKILAISAKEGRNYKDVLKEITGSTNQLKTASEIFGLTAQSQAVVLANSIDSIDGLTSSLENSEGAAKDAALVIGDTLDGDVKKLTSAFEALLLEGGLLDSFFRGFLQYIRSIIEDLVAFGSGIKSLIVDIEDFNDVIEKQNTLRVEQVITQKKVADSAETLLKKYEDLNKEENLTVEQKEELKKVQNDLIGLYGRSAININKETGELVVNVKAIRAKIVAQRALQSTEAKALLEEEARIKARQNAVANIEAELNAIELGSLGARKSIVLTGDAAIDELSKQNAALAGFQDGTVSYINTLRNSVSQGGFVLEETLKRVKQIATEEGKDVNELFDNIEFTTFLDGLRGIAKAVDETEGDDVRLARITVQLRLLGADFKSLIDLTSGSDPLAPLKDPELIGAINKQIAVVEKLQKQKREANEEDISAFDAKIVREEKELKRLLELGVKSVEFKRKEQELDNQIRADRIKKEDKFTEDILALKEKQIKSTSLEEIQKLEEQITDIKRDAEQARLLLDIDANLDRIKLIEEFADVIEGSEQKITDLKVKNEQIRKELDNNQFDDQVADTVKNLEATETEEQKKTEILEKALDDRLELIEQFEENVSKLLDLVQQGLANQTQSRLDGITRSLQENKKIQDELRKDAKDGLVEAEESLTIQKRKEAELEQERLRLEKQQRQRELAFAFLKILNTNLTTYQAKVEEAKSTGTPIPPNTVLVDTLTQGSLLAGAITTGFIDGTENVGRSMGNAPLDGAFDNYIGSVGSKVFKFDGDEAILNPTQNKKRGSLSNDETVDVAHRYLKGDLIEKSKVFDTAISMTNALMALNAMKQDNSSDGVIKALRMDMKVLTSEIKKLPSSMPTSHSGFNNKTGMVEHITKKLGREQTIMERLNKS